MIESPLVSRDIPRTIMLPKSSSAFSMRWYDSELWGMYIRTVFSMLIVRSCHPKNTVIARLAMMISHEHFSIFLIICFSLSLECAGIHSNLLQFDPELFIFGSNN